MNVLEHFQDISCFVFDIDGVLTDSTVLLLENGLQARRMNIKDGLALQMALKNGFKVMIVSGSFSQPVIDRLTKLGVTDVTMSLNDKRRFIEDRLKDMQVSWEQILYMGDDLPDRELMTLAGMPCCPADAVPEILEVAKYISPVNGGYGCVRDVIEKVLRVQDKWIYREGIISR